MTTVFVNGCFDLLAPWHCRFLQRAAEYGDRLIVGLNSDRSVRELKGPSRPFYCQEDRKLMLESIRWVDEVRIFDTEEALAEMIRQLNPVLVKGEEYLDKQVTGAEYAKQVVFLEGTFVGGITENIIKRICDSDERRARRYRILQDLAVEAGKVVFDGHPVSQLREPLQEYYMDFTLEFCEVNSEQ